MTADKLLASTKIIDISDDGLAKALGNDNEVAFSELYERYWEKMFLYAHNVLRDKNMCEDIVQNVFCDLWEKRNKQHIENISSYLYESVKRQIFKKFRQKKNNKVHYQEILEFIDDSRIEQTLEFKEVNYKIEKLIMELPAQRRKIFIMSRTDELSHKEIASQLNLSVRTVKNQIGLALKFIRNSFKIAVFLFFR